MVRSARNLAVGSLALASLAIGSQAARAENEVSELRLAAAKRHMQVVCQPLEARRAFTKAARCYSNVTAYLTDPRVTLAETPRPRLAPETLAAPTRVAMITPRRGSGLLTSNFVLLGVGY